MSGGVWPPPGVVPARPAERPAGQRSKPWLDPAQADRFGAIRSGFRLLAESARLAQAALASFTATTKPADRPKTGAPPP